MASHHIVSHRLSWRCAWHQRILSRFLKYVGRRSKGCSTSQKIGGITITVWHQLSTEYHLEQKVACSTITTSHVARTEVSIVRAAPSHRISFHLTTQAQGAGSASHLILTTWQQGSRQRIASHLGHIGGRQQASKHMAPNTHTHPLLETKCYKQLEQLQQLSHQ